MYSNECVACSTLISLARRASLCPLRQSNRRPHLTHTYSVVGKGTVTRRPMQISLRGYLIFTISIWNLDPREMFLGLFFFPSRSCHMRTFGNFLPEGSLPACPPGRPLLRSPSAGGPVCARVHDGHSFCGASDVTNCHCASPPSLPSSLDADPLARPLAPFTPPIPSIPSSATPCACANRRSSQALREAQ